MIKTAFAMLIITALSYSCRQDASKETNAEAGKPDSTQFFAVSQFIQKEINEVNKTPYFIYKIEKNGGRRDSTAINNEIFNKLSAQFLKPDIGSSELKSEYTENIFEDQTTKGFTISYSAKNKELEIQRIEILLKDDAETVNRIFIRKFLNYPDSSAIEQLSWKPGQSFQIYRSVQKTDNSETLSETTVAWN